MKRDKRHKDRLLEKRNLLIEFKKSCLDINGNEIINENTLILDSDLEVGNEEIITDCSDIIVNESELMETSIPVEKHASVASQTLKHRIFSAENFSNETAGLHFYTGVENIEKFFFILYTLGPSAFCLQYIFHNVVNISVPDQFFLVLMKLRRHTTNFELARMFEMSEKAVQNIVLTWINFMAKQWGEKNIWPSGDLVRYYAPTSFKKKLPNTRVIVDGTEFPIKKNLKIQNHNRKLSPLTKTGIL